MPKKISMTAEQESLMRNLFQAVPRDAGPTRRRPKGSIKTVVAQLRKAGVTLCEDTIRRRAVALGLMEPVGAKYIASTPTNMWRRPCICCKRTDPRPKNQYICDRCSGRDHD